MPESGTSFEHESELRALHARAYGPDPDIQDDPAALARLVELEAARAEAASLVASTSAGASETAGAGEGVPSDPADAGASPGEDPVAPGPVPEQSSTPESEARQSLASRLTSSPSRLLAVAAAAGVAAVAVIYAVAMLVGVRPDATLTPTGATADDLLIELVRNSGPIDIDLSTLRSFETYRGVEPWYAVDDYDNPCLILVERLRQRLVEAQCTPAEADLVADYGVWPALGPGEGLPDGSIVRFQHRGDSVDVFVHPAPAGEPLRTEQPRPSAPRAG